MQCAPGSGGPNCSISRASVPLLALEGDDARGLQLRKPRLSGWSERAAASLLPALMRATNASVAVEVGVWRGLSASYIAGELRNRGLGGVLFAVDTFLGSLEFWTLRFSGGKRDPKRDLELSHGFPSMYYTFVSNMAHLNLSEYVVPLPLPSRTAAQLLNEQRVHADLIHIDASHEYRDVAEDLRQWLPLLSPCGVLVGDDYSDRWPGVVRAVNELERATRREFVWRHRRPVRLRERDPSFRHGTQWWTQRRGCKSASVL